MNPNENPEMDVEDVETVEGLRRDVRERDIHIEKLELALREKDTQLKEMEKKLLTDELTGLYNLAGLRKTAKIMIPETVAENKAEQRSVDQKNKKVGVLALDIDNFKEINDRYGHLEGNRILEEAATFLAGSMRKSDVVARLGGDEFVILLNGATEKIINKFFDREADPQRPRFGFVTTIGGAPKRISFSGGIALVRPKETIDNFEDVVERADQALYASKEAGRDRVTLFHPIALSPADAPAYETQK